MIQDDACDLVPAPSLQAIQERLDAGDARMTRIEQSLADNTQVVRSTAENTSELVELLQALKGAFKVLEFIGKLAKPLAAILSVGVAVAGIWAAIKSGGQQ